MKYVRMKSPEIFLFENVLGLDMERCDGVKSPLTILVEEMTSLGYKVSTQKIDLAVFHQAARPRIANVCQST